MPGMLAGLERSTCKNAECVYTYVCVLERALSLFSVAGIQSCVCSTTARTHARTQTHVEFYNELFENSARRQPELVSRTVAALGSECQRRSGRARVVGLGKENTTTAANR